MYLPIFIMKETTKHYLWGTKLRTLQYGRGEVMVVIHSYEAKSTFLTFCDHQYAKST